MRQRRTEPFKKRAVVINPGTHPELLYAAVSLVESGYEVTYASSATLDIPEPLQKWITRGRMGKLIQQRIPPTALRGKVRSPGALLELSFQIARRFSTPDRAERLMHARNAYFNWRVLRILQGESVDVVFAQQGSAAIVFGAVGAALKVLNAPIAHPEWSLEYLRSDAIANPKWASYIQYPDARSISVISNELDSADIVLTASSFSAMTYRERGVTDSKLRMVPLGSKTPINVEGVPNDRDGVIRVLFAGQVNQRKGIGYFIEAMEEVRELVSVRVAGPFTNGSEELVQSYDWIDFRGPLAQPELQESYRWSDVVVLPSLIEGFGLTALEAMANGRSVIVTEHTFAHDVVTDGVDGLILSPADSPGIAAALRSNATDRLKLVRMGEAALRKHQRFTWGAYVENIREIFSVRP